jgi:hypothetical protein
MHTSSRTWCSFCRNSSSSISGCSSGREVSPSFVRSAHRFSQRSEIRTSFAEPTSAFQSKRERNPRRKSALNSASRTATDASRKRRGKLAGEATHDLAWQASRLCVMSRTIVLLVAMRSAGLRCANARRGRGREEKWATRVQRDGLPFTVTSSSGLRLDSVVLSADKNVTLCLVRYSCSALENICRLFGPI